MENKKNKKEQKNPTVKIDFSQQLMEVTDQELIDFYSNLSVDELKKHLASELPDQDRRIIKDILKK